MTINKNDENSGNAETGAATRREALRRALLTGYRKGQMWGFERPSAVVPDGLERGCDTHLIFLTLTMALSPGREPVALWGAARAALASDPELFDPMFLAYLKPPDLKGLHERLNQSGLTSGRSDTTTWQRIGKALVMRGQGSVLNLLEKHEFEADKVMAMLAESKTTFPVLSGEQTAPLWLYALAVDGGVGLGGVEALFLPLSPAGELAAVGLDIENHLFTVPVWAPLDVLGRLGCAQREGEAVCPAADGCPVAAFCRFGVGSR